MRFLFLPLLYLALLARPVVAQPPDAPLTLPSVTSYSLSKAKVTLPADLSADRNLLLLFFKRDQQDDADAWIPELSKLKIRYPAVAIYTLPIFPRANILSRWWTNASLRSGAPPHLDPATTIPLYVDKSSFLRNLGITSEKQPVLLVTDKSGRVLGRASGRPDPAKLAATEAIVGSAPAAHH
jgi:hypothetical protein